MYYIMNNTFISSFNLCTGDLTTTPTNLGFKNAYNTSFTWSNIDFRKILGSEYNKYDLFNINLSFALATVPTSLTAYVPQDYISVIQLSGLNFINNNISMSYVNNPSMKIGTSCDMGFYNTSLTQSYVFQNFQKYGALISKPGNETLTISLIDINFSSLLLPAQTGTYPDWLFCFKIIGVKK